MSAESPHSCPCCESQELVDLGKLPDSRWFAGTCLDEPLPGGRLFRCSNCRLKFRSPVLSGSAYSELYDNATTESWSGDIVRRDWDLIAGYVSTTLPEGARILDFGCYTGELLARLDDRYERYGVEVNRVAAEVASQNTGHPVWSSIDETPGDLRFDAIIAADVIEHVSNPMSLVKQLSSRLSENGSLILTTGDADNYLWNRFGANWWYCFYPEHIAFISKDWLNYMSRATGLSIERFDTFRYSDLSRVRRISDSTLAYFYGMFPAAFLGLGRLFISLSKHGEITKIPGVGLSRDHLFTVLNRTSND